MSTPYTLMRCRMKDLISCFNACKLPIEKDDEEMDHPKPKESGNGNDRKGEREENVRVGTVAERAVGEESPASWQSCESEEDDYIVFYFKDDAGRDVVEERGLGSSSEKDVIGSVRRKKRNEMRKNRVDAKSDCSETQEGNELVEVTDTIDESSDSSNSSFAFPTIQSEWPGSPVSMPRPEGYKSGGVRIQCCKF